MKTLRLSFASLLLLAACATPCAAQAQRFAFEASPAGSVQKWRSPALLNHGDDDRNVSFSQTADLARRLREQNVEFEQVVFPDDGHDFLPHRHWLRAYAAAADFFDRHLKGQGR